MFLKKKQLNNALHRNSQLRRIVQIINIFECNFLPTMKIPLKLSRFVRIIYISEFCFSDEANQARACFYDFLQRCPELTEGGGMQIPTEDEIKQQCQSGLL